MVVLVGRLHIGQILRTWGSVCEHTRTGTMSGGNGMACNCVPNGMILPPLLVRACECVREYVCVRVGACVPSLYVCRQPSNFLTYLMRHVFAVSTVVDWYPG